MEALTSTLAELPMMDIWTTGGVFTALAVLWWGILLLRRIGTLHERIVVGLVGLVATDQGLHLAFGQHGWTWFANAIGVICSVGAMAMLERVVKKNQNSELALRLSEAREAAPRTPIFELARQASQLKTDVPRSILESAPMAMFAVELDGSVSFWNSAAERLLGWSSEEVLGNRMPNLIANNHAGVFEGGPIRLVRKDGSEVPAPVQSVPVRDGRGDVRGILTIVTPPPVVEQLS